MKNPQVLISASSLDFLINYKLGLSKVFLKNDYKLVWSTPKSYSDLEKIDSIPSEIKISFLDSPRKGLIVFLKMIFSYLLFCLKRNSKVTLISHSVYPNIASIFAFYFLKRKSLKLILFVSGFGPSRIRNSLRIRFLGRLYLMFLRLISNQENVLVITLNYEDKKLIQDFKAIRKVSFLKESGITDNDLILGEKSIVQKYKNYDNKTLNCGFFGRFLLEKGIEDFKFVKDMAKEHDIEINFLLGGSIDKQNSSSIKVDKVFKDLDKIKIFYSPNYADFFDKIDILLFPSYREGHPCFLLRSMAYGVVPIVYPNPGLSVDILDEYNGIVAKYNHPKSIFSSLIKLNNNRQNLLKISQNARKYASKKEQRQSYLDNRMFEKIDFFIKS